jgi:CBS domain protein
MERATTFRADASQRDVFKVLHGSNFDQAPIVNNGDPIGYILRTDLDHESTDSVNAVARDIAPPVLTSGDAPIASVTRWLAYSSFLFVVDGTGITGFVTPADVNKQPGRTYFYLLLAEFEMALAELLRREFESPKAALDMLRPERKERVLKQHDEHRAMNVDADIISEMMFADVLCVARGSSIPEKLGCASKREWDRATGSLENLRNDVMHPVRPLFFDKRPLEKLAELGDRLQDLVRSTSDLLTG